MKCVRRPGTNVGRTENQWLERRVRSAPLDGTPCIANQQLDHIFQDWAPYILHDHIISGDAVRGDEEKCFLVNFVEISDFPLGDFW